MQRRVGERALGPAVGDGERQVVARAGEARVDHVADPSGDGGADRRAVASDHHVVLGVAGGDQQQHVDALEGGSERGRRVEVDGSDRRVEVEEVGAARARHDVVAARQAFEDEAGEGAGRSGHEDHLLRLLLEIPLTLGLLAAPEQRVGVLAGPWGDGRVSVVAREDLAGAAARVVAEAAEGGEHAGRTYELAGVEALSAADVAAVLGVAYGPTPLEPAWAALAERGLPPYQAAHAMSILSNLGAGMLAQPATDLPALLDAPPRPALSLMAAAAAQTIPLQT